MLDFPAMATYDALEWERLTDELRNFEEIAGFVNPSPGEIPRLQGIDVHGMVLPLRHVIGGDHVLYVDFENRFELDVRIEEAVRGGRPEIASRLQGLRRRAGILVADVSGHRMTDALIAAMLHQAFLLGAHYELDLYGEITTRIFEHVNSRFHRTNSFHKYVTMIYGEIWDDGRFRFISAGHQPPSVFSREFGRFMPIDASRLVTFPPVGMLPSLTGREPRGKAAPRGFKKRYQVNEIHLLSPGDILLLLTDGLSEHGGGEYFPGRVERLLADSGEASAEEICGRLRDDLVGYAPPQDDVSFVVVKKTR